MQVTKINNGNCIQPKTNFGALKRIEYQYMIGSLKSALTGDIPQVQLSAFKKIMDTLKSLPKAFWDEHTPNSLVTLFPQYSFYNTASPVLPINRSFTLAISSQPRVMPKGKSISVEVEGCYILLSGIKRLTKEKFKQKLAAFLSESEAKLAEEVGGDFALYIKKVKLFNKIA